MNVVLVPIIVRRSIQTMTGTNLWLATHYRRVDLARAASHTVGGENCLFIRNEPLRARYSFHHRGWKNRWTITKQIQASVIQLKKEHSAAAAAAMMTVFIRSRFQRLYFVLKKTTRDVGIPTRTDSADREVHTRSATARLADDVCLLATRGMGMSPKKTPPPSSCATCPLCILLQNRQMEAAEGYLASSKGHKAVRQ